MKISFLINNIYGIGGTNRTVINLAEALAVHHEVEIVSVFRRTTATKFEISPRVTVRALVDLRPGSSDRGAAGSDEPSEVVPRQEEFYAQYSRFTDQRIIRELKKTDADVVVGTRPSLNLFVAAHTRDGALRVAQEHMTHLAIPPAVRAEMARVYPRLDAITTVTDADARSFMENTPIPGLDVVGIPNSVPQPAVPPSDCTHKVIVSAGRMHHIKRYDLLIRAFGMLAEEFPDWRLRIYGDGGEAGKLRALVTELGLAGRALLMGGFSPIESEWAKGSIAAVTSSAESFGMTLVEAMRCGLPVVSTDCPVGPREILTDGEDGLLVANGDVDAIAWGLRRLMADDALRQAMGATALRNAARYDPAQVAARYVELFEDAARRRAAKAKGYKAPAGPRKTAAALTAVPPTSLGAATVDVTADDAGWLRFSADGPAEGRHRWQFVLRHKPSDGEPLPELPLRTVRKPLDNGGTRYTAAITPSALDHLGDGRWQVTMRAPKTGAVHMKAGIRDTRALIDARDRLIARPPTGPVGWNLPYAQPGGRLMLRTVLRQDHAECVGVEVTDTGIALEGVLCGRRLLKPGALFVVTRRGRHSAHFTVPVHLLGSRRFRAEAPVRWVADHRLERWEDWDWWLRPDPADRSRIRVCHLLEDFPDVKGAYAYPAVPLVGDEPSEYAVIHPARPVWVRPYCSASGAMAMNVVDR
ncbi:glycosyltransferase family 4 protein [Streptomyces ipomoeae]|uniref:D-inositol 3-phosphate glycosyltransferase n=1 Tax=Streptomyces ipomoeae 91-03 TaxID=698759 RepID=L1KT26_9ACTN|nr:glycosyltransferase family 4 protein [Streptomyces ipomoeae]EKX63699.1 glycosyltransferase, group 1 family protein [Streptomyces ipomoeae 91-03]MDX2692346.1 glycosyltransferase family 4 protein [Streptomyces ipomoeae]MDX2840395.1 glycosyltransferase family 4 protein [Streptomyces ipomoeae]TQE40335.1 glycosyltransferase family 4 protein [Streptomyces ipomoeae]